MLKIHVVGGRKMLGSFLDRITGIFDRRFIVAHWCPTFITIGLAISVAMVIYGPHRVVTFWTTLQPFEQVWFSLAFLLIVTTVAYLLQTFTVPLVRLYEGYLIPSWLAERSRNEQRKVWQSLKNIFDSSDEEVALKGIHQPGAYHKFYYNFPRDSVLIRPTQLGNVLTAAEEYPYQIYRLDAVLWWPRLVPLLPETFRNQIDLSLMPLLALINLSALLTLLSLGCAVFLVLTDHRWWLFILVFGGGLLLSWVAYQAAVSQAANYGSLIRVAFDLYRHEILKQMHIPLPQSLLDEGVLWDTLNQWIYRYIPPWDTEPTDPSELVPLNQLYYPFYYDTHDPPPQPSSVEMSVIVKGEIGFTLQNQEAIDE